MSGRLSTRSGTIFRLLSNFTTPLKTFETNAMSTADETFPGSRYSTSSTIGNLRVWSVASPWPPPPPPPPPPQAAVSMTISPKRPSARRRIPLICSPFWVILYGEHCLKTTVLAHPLALFPEARERSLRGESAPTRGRGCDRSLYSGHHYCPRPEQSQVRGSGARPPADARLPQLRRRPASNSSPRTRSAAATKAASSACSMGVQIAPRPLDAISTPWFSIPRW